MQTLLIDQLVGQIIGGYRVERLLVQGRLSAVYLARHPEQNSTVALNTFIIPEQFSREAHNRFMVRFTKEALALTSLHHRHLLPVYAYGEQFGYPYLVTPYMTHGSLADILKEQGRCEPAYVLDVLEQVAAGLDYAHRKGVMHGTLKPANILLNQEQRMLVAGFGLMSMLQMRGIEENNQPYAHLLSIAGTFLATPEYIAPEVIQGQPMDARSDIYALGIVLFELLHGKPPFTAEAALDAARQPVQQSLPSLHELHADIPIALELVVNHALSRDPARRFQHASELVEAFAQVCRGMTDSTKQRVLEKNISAVNKAKMRATIYADDLGNVADQGTIEGNWQLSPPIVTSKTFAVRPFHEDTSSTTGKTAIPKTTGPWQLLPPIVTGKLPAIEPAPSVPPQRRVTEPAAPVFKETGPVQKPRVDAPPLRPEPPTFAPNSMPRPAPVQPMPRSYKADVTPADWWTRVPSEPEEVLRAPNPMPVPTTRQEPVWVGQAPYVQPEQAYMHQTARSKSDVVRIPPQQKRSQPLPRRSRGMGRRKVIAMLATGGVAAAGVLVVGKMNLASLASFIGTPPQPVNGTHANTGTKAAPTGKTTPPAKKTPSGTGNGAAKPTQPPAQKTGNVIGSTNLGQNMAADFTNPADGKGSILVHLPNNTFAAYEKACTHEGVTVYYDTGAHMLVCPAHGAIFDPANHGAVVQGPATKPIASVMIHVNADGTITTV